MKAAIDTNIVLDVLARREPFFAQSNAILRLVASGKIEGAITANTITDICYILRKSLDGEKRKETLRGLMELFEVLDVTREECMAALDLPVEDYEDALLACCAETWRADCIVTRNEKDFAHARVAALSPGDFLDIAES